MANARHTRRKFEPQFARLARSFAEARAGSSMPARIAMMAMTTSSSTSVNAAWRGQSPGRRIGEQCSFMMAILPQRSLGTLPVACERLSVACGRLAPASMSKSILSQAQGVKSVSGVGNQHVVAHGDKFNPVLLLHVMDMMDSRELPPVKLLVATTSQVASSTVLDWLEMSAP